MTTETIIVNRAPVLTLWAVVVAERLGFDHQEALTLGKAVAGLNAQAKGQALGIFHPAQDKPDRARELCAGEVFFIELLGRPVPAINTPEGIRAAIKGKPIDPGSVERYVEGKFGEALGSVRAAMETLAASYDPQELASKSYTLYARFRPEIPEGKAGWGAAGALDLQRIRALSKSLKAE